MIALDFNQKKEFFLIIDYKLDDDTSKLTK